MCPETGLGQARRLASVVVEKCRGALSVKQDNQTRPPWRRTVSLLASVVLMLASAWSALIWVNAVGSLSSWVGQMRDRKSTRLNSSHGYISYAVFCLKKKKNSTKPSCTS